MPARKIQEASAVVAKQPAKKQKGEVEFVKNQVNEKIVFSDKTTYKFPASLHVVSDPELIEKIREVADKFGIFERK